MDLTQFFNPSAWGSWSQPNQSMVGPKPVMPMAPGTGGTAGAPMTLPSAPQAGGTTNPLSMMLGPLASQFNSTPIGQKVESAFDQWQKSHPQQGMMGGMSGNPMLAKFGGAMMNGQNPLQAMTSPSGMSDFAKWMAQRRQAQPGQPAQFTPQPPVPTQSPGMLGGLM